MQDRYICNRLFFPASISLVTGEDLLFTFHLTHALHCSKNLQFIVQKAGLLNNQVIYTVLQKWDSQHEIGLEYFG